MEFQINQEEYEVTEEKKERDIRFELADAIHKIDFLQERYQERIKGIGQRRTNLLHTIIIYGVLLLAFILLAIMFGTMAHPAFGWVTVILFLILAAITSVRLIKMILSYCTHIGLIPKGDVYTVIKEEQDCRQYIEQLKQHRKCLEEFMEQPEPEEEKGRILLKEILPQLVENEKRADWLYGEVDKL